MKKKYSNEEQQKCTLNQIVGVGKERMNSGHLILMLSFQCKLIYTTLYMN